MTTNIFKTAKQAAAELNKIAAAYGFVYETIFIEKDMEHYAKEVIEWHDSMKAEKSYFNYSHNLWIRRSGVECLKSRADYFGGIIAKITVEFNKETKEYKIIRENI